MMQAVPSQRRNHSQAKCRTRKSKKPGGKNSSRNRSFKRHSRAVILQELSPEQQLQCQLGSFLEMQTNGSFPGLPIKSAWGGIQLSVLTGLPGDANF